MNVVSIRLSKGECRVCGGPTYSSSRSDELFPCNSCDDGVSWLRTWMKVVAAKAIAKAINEWESYNDRVRMGIFLVDQRELTRREIAAVLGRGPAQEPYPE